MRPDRALVKAFSAGMPVPRPALAPCRCIWDGQNSRGETAANNIYFCVIESEGRRLIRKIALIR